MKIVIPVNGYGRRFSLADYIVPKPMVNIYGKPIVLWVLDSLKVSQNDEIIIVYNEMLDRFNFTQEITRNFKSCPVKFHKLIFGTRGAAETVFCGINDFVDEEKFLVLDSDTIYQDNIIEMARYRTDSTIFYFIDQGNKPIYSYIKIENNKAVDIKEKKKISNFASVGAYLFSSARIYRKYYEATDAGKEFYISNVYGRMLEGRENIDAIKIELFDCVGTPEQLQCFAASADSAAKHRFCFDLDNTLVTYPMVSGDYTTVGPIEKNIGFLRFLFSKGHYIIIHTARRMKTHGGNMGAIVKDVGKITIDTLEKFKIPYHELCFGKPWADYYIDDLSISPSFNLCKYTGFYNNYIEPRKDHEVIFKENSIIKSGQTEGEKYWYEKCPEAVSHLFPLLIDSGDGYIELERLRGVTFSQLYVNKSLTLTIFNKLIDALKLLHDLPSADVNIYANYIDKIKHRYETYDYSRFGIKEYIAIVKGLEKYQGSDAGKSCLIHGDPVFTNVFLENKCIKLIDMRGKLGESLSLYGDRNYDYAKVYQSLIGYDYILNGMEVDNDYANEFIGVFEGYIIERHGLETFNNIKLITASLLFSLIPLHDNEKCVKYFNLIGERQLI